MGPVSAKKASALPLKKVVMQTKSGILATVFGVALTGCAGSSLRPSRTDSVSRGASLSLFTLESVVLALLAGFFPFCMVNARMDRSQSLFSITHTAF